MNTSAATISPNLDDENTFDQMEWFNDIFDIFNDNDDDNNEREEEKLEHIIEEYNQDFDFDYIHTNVDEEEMMMINEDNNKIVQEEEILSQTLSQLSTNDEFNNDDNDDEQYSVRGNKKRPLSAPSTPQDTVPKKIRLWDMKNQTDDQIPQYLQSSNKLFDQIIGSHVTTMTTEDLRQLAILKHNIALININRKLWTTYLKSVTGQWETQASVQTSVDRRVWPMEVKQMILSTSNTILLSQEKDEQKMCETQVHDYLEELNNSTEHYEHELNEKKNSFMDYTDDIENTIEKFIQQHGLRPFQMKLDYKIAILKYDYDAELLEREYLQLKPTEYQIQLAQRLYDLRLQYLEATHELIELKQRIRYNQPTKAMSSPTSFSSMSTAIDDGTIIQGKVCQQEKLTDSMIAAIIELEDRIHEYQQLFEEETLQLSVNDKNDNGKGEGLTGKLVDLIYRRFKIIDKKLQYIHSFRINYFLRNRHHSLENTMSKSPIRFLPSLVLDTSTSHQLTNEQLKLLNRGPTYVPPCQMYVSSSVSMEDSVQKQYKLLQHHLTLLFGKFHLNTAQSMFINKEIKDVFTNMFSISLPPTLHQRALYEKQLVQSIREHLKTNQLILRRLANQSNVFYLGNLADFQQKASEYMAKTDTFELCELIDANNLQRTHEYLNKMIKSINSELENIFPNKKVSKDLLEKLYIDMAKVQLPYLYFLPDVSKSKKGELSLKPVVVVSQRSATARLAYFLDKLLRPVFQRHGQATTFVNGADFMQKLHRYTEDKERFRPTTIFTTMHIPNFNTMVPHGTMLIALKDFLDDHLAIPSIENISVNRIIHLTSLFLHNNRFYYDNKIYRFTKGAPSSFPLAETLGHIYIYQWQKLLLREPSMEKELYGRCKNQIFFTWNATVGHFRQLFHVIGNRYPELEAAITMGRETQFINAHLENLNGTLYSRVYHDPNSQKYTLPYVIGDAKGAHSHWLRSALIRAVRYCTSVYDFDQERIYLEITCLANGYSVEFIEQRVNHFFTHFDALSLRLALDQNIYEKLRHRLFNYISEQHRVFAKNQELINNNQRLHLTYLYQYGPKHKFNKKLREILSQHLHTSSTYSSRHKKLQIILSTQQRYSLNALLSQQKPVHPLLNNEKLFL